MPPLTESPPAFYAEVGSEEDNDRISLAKNGEYAIWRADTESRAYHVFVESGEIPTIALTAMVHLVREKGEGRPNVRRETLKTLKSIGMKDVKGAI